MNPAQFRFWGVRGSFPAARPGCRLLGGNTSCIQVQYQGHELILDAGTGIRRLGDHLLAHPSAHPLHLLITHPHWDHIQGFPFFAPANRAETRLQIHSVVRPLKLKALLSDQQQSTFFGLPLKKLASELVFHEWAEGETAHIGPFQVHTWRLNHPGVCSGWRIQAGEYVLAYICDVAPSTDHLLADPLPGLGSSANNLRHLYENQLRLAEGADVVIYDTFFTAEQYIGRSHWGHSTLEHALDLCRRCRVPHLFTFHHNAEIDDQDQLARIPVLEGLTVRAAREGDGYRLDTLEPIACA